MTAQTLEGQNPRQVGPILGMHVLLIVPFLGTLGAVVDAYLYGVPVFYLYWTVFFYIATGAVGVAMGLHRYWTHESFQTYPFIQWVMGICAHMAWQGSILRWCAIHWKHHLHSDKAEDPHTPYINGTSKRTLKGFWHAHFEWLTENQPLPDNSVSRRLQKNMTVWWIDALAPLWMSLSLIVPMVLGYWYEGSLHGVLRGLIWIGFVRIFVLHQITWCVNSVCHMWGAQPFESGDQSRDNAFIAFLGFGEGEHNGHHTFPWSPKHGLVRAWRDFTWLLLRLLEVLGLVWGEKKGVRVELYDMLPTPAQLERKRRMA